MYIRRALGGEELVFEDPDYQMLATPPLHATPQITAGDVDLEKGGAFKTAITRADSRFPRVAAAREADGSAGSGDTRSSCSR
jgi:hypothetical protein